jgi:hypothetical protein
MSAAVEAHMKVSAACLALPGVATLVLPLATRNGKPREAWSCAIGGVGDGVHQSGCRWLTKRVRGHAPADLVGARPPWCAARLRPPCIG